MNNYSHPEMVNYIIGGLFVFVVFSIAYAYLKPHRLHHARPISTFALKASYLLYLLVILLVMYFASLRGGGLSNVFDGPEFFVFLLVLFIPTAGLFARRIGHFSANRVRYNLVFTAVNIIMTVTVLLLYKY